MEDWLLKAAEYRERFAALNRGEFDRAGLAEFLNEKFDKLNRSGILSSIRIMPISNPEALTVEARKGPLTVYLRPGKSSGLYYFETKVTEEDLEAPEKFAQRLVRLAIEADCSYSNMESSPGAAALLEKAKLEAAGDNGCLDGGSAGRPKPTL